MSSIIVDIDFPAFDGNGLNVVGTEEMDLLDGSNQDDYIRGFGGNDLIRGGNGDDILLGGLGKDTVFGYNGNDYIDGGAGNDLIRGGNGEDMLLGGKGNDVIFGDNSKDTIIGGEGSDTMYGGYGKDTFEFFAEDFGACSIDKIVNFKDGQDTLIIKGMSSNDQVSYDSSTGQVLLNGKEIIDLGKSLDVNITTNDNGDFEIM